MTTFEILAQAVGILAMTLNVLSYQQKTSGKVMVFQLFGSALFAINFFMLGATIGGLMNVIATFRAVVYMNKKKLHTDHLAWLIVFIALYVISYILTFTVFGKEFTLINAVLELLPVIALTASTISYRLQSAKSIRIFGLISSPSWLVYNIVNMAVGAIICEVLSLCSIVIGLFRYDIKPNKETK